MGRLHDRLLQGPTDAVAAELRAYLNGLTAGERDCTHATMVDLFMTELAILDAARPLIVCLGADAHEWARAHLAKDFELTAVTHYSAAIGNEAYRDELTSVARN